jgi:3-oxoacyl-[acyl-carrier-protein] synthase-3
VLVEASEDESVGILDQVCWMDGEGEEALHIPAGGSVQPATAESLTRRQHYVVQDGPAAFRAAVIGMAEVTEQILKRNKPAAPGHRLAGAPPGQPPHHRGGRPAPRLRP